MLRRKATSPQSTVDVLVERIANLEDQVKQLRQAGPSHVQSDAHDKEYDPFPWQMMLHWPGGHRVAWPESNMVYYHPGRVHPVTGEVTPAGFKHVAPPATHAIKVFTDTKANKVGTGVFRFHITEDLADTKLIRAEAGQGVVGTGVTTVQLTNQTRGTTLLDVPITIDSGDDSSYFATTPSEVNVGGDPTDPDNKVHLGNWMWIDTLAVGTGSKGLALYLTFA